MGDKSRHITYFKVENFKRFESFEMKDIGQFNLIVGDNNVGKTSVLEALTLDEPAWVLVNNLLTTLNFKNLKNNYRYADLELYLNKHSPIKQNTITYYFTTNSENRKIQIEFNKEKYHLEIKGIPNDSTSYNLNDQAYINQNYSVPFLPFYKGHASDLANFYSRKIQGSAKLKRRFTEALRVMIPDFLSMELSQPDPTQPSYLIFSKESEDSPLPLAMFGDGTLKLFRILTEIITHSGKRLMIDEVDTGIHFSRFKEFWKVVLTAAKENDVQLFMTTHNEECIKYFKEVLENDLPELKEDVRSISLVENHKTKQVFSFTYSFEEFESNVNLGNEIRG